MRSIFLKIFLWFWATLLLVGMAVAITFSVQPDLVLSRWRAASSDAIALYAQSLADQSDRYGPEATAHALYRLQASSHFKAALLDQFGQPVAGHLPPGARSLIKHPGRGDAPEYKVTPSAAFAAQRVLGPSGRPYLFVVEMPRGSAGFLRWPARVVLFRWLIEAVISAAICYLLARYLTQPILLLRSAAAGIASGDLSARAEARMEKRRDEFGDLVRAFNEMAGRIEALVASQRQLMGDISHGLRSPLARLTVALGLARKQSGDQLASTLDRIELESERLNELIGKLLSLTRMESASAPPLHQPVDLRELLYEVVADTDFEAHERNCRVELQPQLNGCRIEGDPEMLRIAIENVVRNAVRYTPPDTKVSVGLQMIGEWAEVAIRDRGPGVPESELTSIFLPFHRVADARDRASGGTGLGLAITDRALRLHGGTVSARNADEGGLVVTMRLPCV
jgi:two-component system sensor histidine kinase CpxA